MSTFDYNKVKDPSFFQENRLPAHSDHKSDIPKLSKGTGAKIKRAATIPAWILWRRHWNLYPDGKIGIDKEDKKTERIPQTGKGLRNFFAHSITKKCASVQKIGMDIERV